MDLYVIKNPWIEHPEKKSIAQLGACKLLIPHGTSFKIMQVMLGAQPQLGIYPLVNCHIAMENHYF